MGMCLRKEGRKEDEGRGGEGTGAEGRRREERESYILQTLMIQFSIVLKHGL